MTHRQSYYQRDEDKLEGVQRSAAKMIRELEGLIYKESFTRTTVNMHSRAEQHLRGRGSPLQTSEQHKHPGRNKITPGGNN